MKPYALHLFHELVDTRDDSPYYDESYEIWNTLRNADRIHTFNPTPETYAYRLEVIKKAGYDTWSDHAHGQIFYEDFSDDFWIDARQAGLVDWHELTMFMGHESVFRYCRTTFPRLNLRRKSLEVSDIIDTLDWHGSTLTDEEYVEISDILFSSILLLHHTDEANGTDLFSNIILLTPAVGFLNERASQVVSVPGLAAKLLVAFNDKRNYHIEQRGWFHRYLKACSEEEIVFLLSKTPQTHFASDWFVFTKNLYMEITGYPAEWVDLLIKREPVKEMQP